MSIFYLPSTGTAPITPSADHSSWGAEGSAFNHRAAVRTDRILSAASTKNSGEASQSSDRSGYAWVYGPIGAQTISGDVEIRVRGRANTFVNIYDATAAIWIAKPDATLRATLLNASAYTNTTDWTTSYANYVFTATLTSGVASDGDYLVLEVGTVAAFLDVDSFDVEAGDANSSTAMYFDFDDTIVVAAPSSLTYNNSGQTITAGNAMTNMTPTVTGSVSGYAIQTGSLPPGVTIHATTGVISGTPTTGGSYSWTVRATGEGGTTDSGSLTMTVNSRGAGWTFDLRLR